MFTNTYGTFEARIKLPGSSGLWPAWWMLPALAENGAAVWPPEINVHEYFISRPRESVQTVHFNMPTQFNAPDGNLLICRKP